LGTLTWGLMDGAIGSEVGGGEVENGHGLGWLNH
jgi:hypothetical protein